MRACNLDTTQKKEEEEKKKPHTRVLTRTCVKEAGLWLQHSFVHCHTAALAARSLCRRHNRCPHSCRGDGAPCCPLLQRSQHLFVLGRVQQETEEKQQLVSVWWCVALEPQMWKNGNAVCIFHQNGNTNTASAIQLVRELAHCKVCWCWLRCV